MEGESDTGCGPLHTIVCGYERGGARNPRQDQRLQAILVDGLSL